MPTLRNEMTELFNAIRNEELSSIQVLLNREINLEILDNESRCTPLLLAVNLGYLEICQVLLNAGASPLVLDGYSINNAIDNNRLDLLSFLIEEVKLDINSKMEDDKTPLMNAALIGNFDAVQQLIKYGADVNLMSRKNEFALMNAACQGWQDIYNYIEPLTNSKLKYWAEKELSGGLIYRQRYDNLLLTEFIMASARGDLEGVRSGIKRQVDINAFGVNETTALFIAANWSQVHIVNELIQAGADLNLGREENRETPLMVAIGRIALAKSNFGCAKMEKDLFEIIDTLLKNGANVNSRTTDNWTALLEAVNSGSIKSVTLLLKHGANVNIKDIIGETPLNIAKERNNTEIIQLLLDAGATE